MNLEDRIDKLEQDIKSISDKLNAYIESKKCQHCYNPNWSSRATHKYTCGKCGQQTDNPTGYNVYRGD